MPTATKEATKKVSLNMATKAAIALVQAKLDKKQLEQDIEGYEAKMRAYCDQNNYVGPIGPMIAYEKTLPAKLEGSAEMLKMLIDELPKGYKIVIPRKVKPDVKNIVKDLEDNDTIAEILDDLGISIHQETKIYFKHQA